MSKDKYFKLLGQKVTGNKMILIAVVDDNFLGDVPTIFEMQALNPAPTIYSGTYPTIRVITDSVKDVTEEFRGMGINGILTENMWYCATRENKNEFGINLPDPKP